MGQRERIFFIYDTIGKKGLVKVNEVARVFDVDERTIKRDIEYMRNKLKVAVEWDQRKRGYVILQTSGQAFDHIDEKLFIAVSSFIGAVESMNFPGVMKDILVDSASRMLSSPYGEAVGKVISFPRQLDEPPYELLNRIACALSGKCIMSFNFCDGGTVSLLHTEPKRLVNVNGMWKLVVFDLASLELKVFDVGKISDVSLENVAFVHDVDDSVRALVSNMQNEDNQ